MDKKQKYIEAWERILAGICPEMPEVERKQAVRERADKLFGVDGPTAAEQNILDAMDKEGFSMGVETLVLEVIRISPNPTAVIRAAEALLKTHPTDKEVVRWARKYIQRMENIPG